MMDMVTGRPDAAAKPILRLRLCWVECQWMLRRDNGLNERCIIKRLGSCPMLCLRWMLDGD